MDMGTRLSLRTLQLFVCMSLTLVMATVGIAAPSVYPAKPIEVVVPFAPGGGTDLTARILVDGLSKRWNQAVSILNKPGGTSVIGVNYVMHAAPDGYTILFDSAASSSLQVLMKDLPYKLEERTFLGGSNALPGVFVVPGNSPWQNLGDVAEAAKKDPGNFTWASAGGSTHADFLIRQFFAAAGIEVAKTKIVVFPGAGPAINAVAGGHVQFSAAGANAVPPLIDSGLIRCIGITSPRRVKALPNVPTTQEQGFPSVNTIFWGGFSGPPGLPEEVVKTWSQTLKEILSDPELVSKLEKQIIMPLILTSDDFKTFVLDEAQKVKQLFRESK